MHGHGGQLRRDRRVQRVTMATIGWFLFVFLCLAMIATATEWGNGA